MQCQVFTYYFFMSIFQDFNKLIKGWSASIDKLEFSRLFIFINNVQLADQLSLLEKNGQLDLYNRIQV